MALFLFSLPQILLLIKLILLTAVQIIAQLIESAVGRLIDSAHSLKLRGKIPCIPALPQVQRQHRAQCNHRKSNPSVNRRPLRIPDDLRISLRLKPVSLISHLLILFSAYSRLLPVIQASGSLGFSFIASGGSLPVRRLAFSTIRVQGSLPPADLRGHGRQLIRGLAELILSGRRLKMVLAILKIRYEHILTGSLQPGLTLTHHISRVRMPGDLLEKLHRFLIIIYPELRLDSTRIRVDQGSGTPGYRIIRFIDRLPALF